MTKRHRSRPCFISGGRHAQTPITLNHGTAAHSPPISNSLHKQPRQYFLSGKKASIRRKLYTYPPIVVCYRGHRGTQAKQVHTTRWPEATHNTRETTYWLACYQRETQTGTADLQKFSSGKAEHNTEQGTPICRRLPTIFPRSHCVLPPLQSSHTKALGGAASTNKHKHARCSCRRELQVRAG